MTDLELDRILDSWVAPGAPPMQFAAPRRRIRRPLVLLALAAALVAVAVGASLATWASLGSETARWDESTWVRRTRRVEPALAWVRWKPLATSGQHLAGGGLGGTVRLLNRWTGREYIYQWSAERLTSGQYRFASESPRFSAVAGPGDTIDVPIFESGQERVYERIELAARPLGLEPDPVVQQFTLSSPQLYVNGAKVLDSDGVQRLDAPLLAIDIPGKGRIQVSLAQRANFVANGSARANRISFEHDGSRYEIRCEGAAATMDGPVFTRFDENVRPAGYGLQGDGRN